MFIHTKSALGELRQAFSDVLLLDDLKVLIYRQAKEIPDYLTGHDPDAKEEFRSYAAQIAMRFHESDRLAGTPVQARYLGDLRRAYAAHARLADRIFRAYDSKQYRRALGLMEHDVENIALPALDQAVASLHRALYASSFERVMAQAQSFERTAQMVSLLAVLTTFGAGLLIFLWLSRGLVRPINALVEATREVGQGNLDIQGLPVSRDEIGELASAFSGMVQRIKHFQTQIVETEQMASIGATAVAVAHGLRNPLASVRALAQVALVEHESFPAVNESLHEIIAEVDRLNARISHLLTFAVPARLHPVSADLNDVIERVVADFQQIKPQQVVFALHLDPGLPSVQLDTVHMKEVLREIVLNALEAMPDGGDVRVATKRGEGPEGRPILILEVADTGRGIAVEALPHVFEPFYTTRADGTGLGLSIVRRLVEQQGGTVAVESHPGAGACVRLTFPLHEPGERM